MRTTISVSLSRPEIQQVKKLVKQRGFSTTSSYIRYLLSEDDVDVIQEKELLQLSRSADTLYRTGKLVHANSLADLAS